MAMRFILIQLICLFYKGRTVYPRTCRYRLQLGWHKPAHARTWYQIFSQYHYAFLLNPVLKNTFF